MSMALYILACAMAGLSAFELPFPKYLVVVLSVALAYVAGKMV